MAGQRRDILAALAQRRQAQSDNIQPMQQIFAEQALLNAFFQILMRRGDDANVGAQRCVTADAIVFAVSQHTQKSYLQIGWHVTNFIEEKRAAVGLLETSAA